MRKAKIGLPALPAAPMPAVVSATSSNIVKQQQTPVRVPLRPADANRTTVAAAVTPQQPVVKFNLKHDGKDDDDEDSETTSTTNDVSLTKTQQTTSRNAGATSTTSSATSTGSSNSSDSDDDDDDTFNLFLPADGISREPIATPSQSRRRKAATISSNNKPSTVDASTNCEFGSVDDNNSSNETRHLQAQLRRLQTEHARLLSDADFFRDATTILREQLVAGKRQTTLLLEFFAEDRLRSAIVAEEVEARKHLVRTVEQRLCFKQQVVGVQALLRAAKEENEKLRTIVIADLEKRLLCETAKCSAAEKQLNSVTSDLAVAKRDAEQKSAELEQCRRSIKAMTVTWQSRFDDQRAKYDKVQSRFNEIAQEVMRLRGADEQLKQLRRRQAATLHAERTSSLLLHEQEARAALVASEAELFDGTIESVARCERGLLQRINKAHADAARSQRRAEEASAESDVLVARNGALQEELLSLRRTVLFNG